MLTQKAVPIPQRYLVSVEKKKIGHPLFDMGSSLTFVFREMYKNRKIRKAVAKPLVLQLGETYQFEFDETVKNHPLFFTTVAYVIMADRSLSRHHSLMINQDKIKDRGKVQIAVNTDLQLKILFTTTQGLFYQCWNHPAMGGNLMIQGANSEWEAVIKN